jgi:ABC-type multidrug transport system fused ATPase/permease subunit
VIKIIQEIYDYYKNELGVENLVFKDISRFHFLLSCLPWISLILSIYLMLTIDKYITLKFVAITLGFASFFLVFNIRTKKIIKSKYKIESNRWMWNSPEVLMFLRTKQKKKLKKKLEENRPTIKAAYVRDLSEDISNKSDIEKVKFPVIPSAILILFLPVWSNFVGWIYNSELVNSFDDALIVLVGCIIVIISFVGSIYALKSIAIDFIDAIYNKDSIRLKRLSELLYEMSKEIEHEEIKTKLDNDNKDDIYA